MEINDIKIGWFIDEYFTTNYGSTTSLFDDLENRQNDLESTISDVDDESDSIKSMTRNSDSYEDADELAKDIENSDLEYYIEQSSKRLNELDDVIFNLLDSYDHLIKNLIYDLIETKGIQYVIDEYGINTDKHEHLKNLAIKEYIGTVYDDLE